jgi:MFS transporter, DHA1 family, multidrug resistance protein
MPIRLSLLVTLGLLSGLTPFAIDMYLPSLPSIARDLGSTIEMAQLSVTVYLGVFALAQLILGPLSDVYGRRVIIGGGLFLFALGSLGCIFADDMGILLGARAIQGLGGAAVAVTIPALVRDLYERDDFARVMSLVMLTMALAPLLAPSVGGLILTYAGWHWVFVALLAITLAAIALFLGLVPETLVPARRHPPEMGRVLRNYLAVLRQRTGLGYLLTGTLSFGGMMIFIVTSPYVYIELHGVSPGLFGILFGVNVALAMLFTSLNARLIRRLGSERLLRLGLGVQFAAALALLGLLGLVAPRLWMIALAAALYLSMAGLVLGNAMAGFMALYPRMAGTASAFAGAGRFGLGALLGSLASLMHDGTAYPLLLGMAMCGFGAGVTYRLLCLQAGTAKSAG